MKRWVLALCLMKALIVPVQAAHASVCEQFLSAIKETWSRMSGKLKMEEGVPIGKQRIARIYLDDQGLFDAWDEREMVRQRNSHPLYKRSEILGVDQTTVDIILALPNWKGLTNSELRSLLTFDLIYASLAEGYFDSWEKLSGEDRFERHVLEFWNENVPTKRMRSETEFYRDLKLDI